MWHLQATPSLCWLLQSLVTLLVARLEARDVIVTQCQVLGLAAGDTLAPHFEAGSLHVLSHQADDFGFIDAKLDLDRVEGSAIFPRHLDDAVDLFGRQGAGVHVHADSECRHAAIGARVGCAFQRTVRMAHQRTGMAHGFVIGLQHIDFMAAPHQLVDHGLRKARFQFQ